MAWPWTNAIALSGHPARVVANPLKCWPLPNGRDKGRSGKRAPTAGGRGCASNSRAPAARSKPASCTPCWRRPVMPRPTTVGACACRLRVGIPVRWPLANAPGCGSPSTRRASPSARGGRGDGPRAAVPAAGTARAKRIPHATAPVGGRSGARLASALLLGRIASDGCGLGDPAGRRGAQIDLGVARRRAIARRRLLVRFRIPVDAQSRLARFVRISRAHTYPPSIGRHATRAAAKIKSQT
jgi:hypothetical protein